MIDLKIIRSDPDFLDAKLKKRGLDPKAKIILDLDQKHRSALTRIQELQNKRHTLTQDFVEAKKQNQDLSEITNSISNVKRQIDDLQIDVKTFQEKLDNVLHFIPNLVDDSCPEGLNEDSNLEIYRRGNIKKTDFTPLPHFELGEQLGQMDFERASKISGSRFVLLYSDLALMERAVASFMIDNHCQKFGYKEVYIPTLVNSHTMFGTGQLPALKDDMFHTSQGMWLIPTSEVVLTNLVSNEILEEKDLPLRFTAYSNCYRSEAGAAGKDTRGMIRNHQFSKVELVSITKPEQSDAEHERMTIVAESILEALDLPYRKMLLCTGDMGFSSKKTYDLEVWLPSQNAYREISSCSNCGDFQARRMNARFKDEPNTKPKFVHTLNGSGLAVGRTLLAILENYQNADGSITVPDVLVKYMNGKKIIQK